MTSKVKLVVAAFLLRGNDILICQRDINDPMALRWEFPGGKIEAGETPEEALRRELQEELTIDAVVGKLAARVRHEYPNGPVIDLQFFYIQSYTGEESNQVFAQFRWVDRRKLEDFDFLDADKDIASRLASGEL